MARLRPAVGPIVTLLFLGFMAGALITGIVHLAQEAHGGAR